MRLPLSLLLAAPALAQTVTLRSIVPLGSTAIDQHGAGFTVTGMSGIERAPDGSLWAVLDNSSHLVELDVTLASDGAALSADLGAGFSLAEAQDFEGLTFAHTGAPWISEEGGMTLRRYDPVSGALLEVQGTPAVFASRRSNRGLESATGTCGGDLWTANEEALTVDGPASSPTNGTLVRLLEVTAGVPARQFAYEVEPMHGPFFPGNVGQSGLVDLVALPGGGLLALERSLALASPPLLSRIYSIDLSGATDVSGEASLLSATYTPAQKTLLWQGSAANLEGLCLGPELAGGHRALLGVIDDGDPLSSNALVTFELAGLVEDCGCYPVSYCQTSPNSAGPGTLMGFVGTTSVAANDLTLVAGGGPPQTFGLFAYSPLADSIPLGDGQLCLGPGLVRFPVLRLDGVGTALQVVDHDLEGFQPGDTRYFQLWYRDPGFGAAGFNLSNGLEITFCP